MRESVFAYGSLAVAGAASPALLCGYRRRWGVAMDNAQRIPGYKRYRAADGTYPDVCVAFLDLEEADEATVEGVLLPAAALEALDARERNYVRTDVTELVDAPGAGRVWAYIGRDDSRQRLHTARAAGRAVVQRAYERAVEHLAAVPHGLPVLDLQRVDLPSAAPRVID